VALVVQGAKLSGRLLAKAIQKFLTDTEKQKQKTQTPQSNQA